MESDYNVESYVTLKKEKNAINRRFKSLLHLVATLKDPN